jgi:phage tail tape-measure protein
MSFIFSVSRTSDCARSDGATSGRLLRHSRGSQRVSIGLAWSRVPDDDPAASAAPPRLRTDWLEVLQAVGAQHVDRAGRSVARRAGAPLADDQPHLGERGAIGPGCEGATTNSTSRCSLLARARTLMPVVSGGMAGPVDLRAVVGGDQMMIVSGGRCGGSEPRGPGSRQRPKCAFGPLAARGRGVSLRHI